MPYRFVSNRVLMPLLNEAMFAVMEGVATPEAVDKVFQLGMAHPMGPLTLADFIRTGRLPQDASCACWKRGLGDPKYRPCPLPAHPHGLRRRLAGTEVRQGIF